MKIEIICFSMTGLMTAQTLAEGFEKGGHQASVTGKSKYLPDSYQGSCAGWAGEHFDTSDALVFVGSAGIAVRSIAPFVTSKKTDPAVLVIDECGHHVISLLSGHLGGANALTLEAAIILGAEPVITTATDLHGRFAVDVFAKELNAAIFHMKAAKEVSAALLAGKNVGFYSEFPLKGTLPEGITPVNELKNEFELGVAVTIHKSSMPFAHTVQVVPRCVHLGMGCKKGKDADSLAAFAREQIEALDLYPEALAQLASIDLKKDETGLIALAESYGIPFVTYTADELQAAPGHYTASPFVQQTTGVDNICERSAVLSSGGGTILKRKTSDHGMTFSAAVKQLEVVF